MLYELIVSLTLRSHKPDPTKLLGLESIPQKFAKADEYIYIYSHAYMYIHIYTEIYAYIYREREREGERDKRS